jgi:hypothetical protein
VSAIDDVMRFRGAHEVKAYLGLVPCELSSVERQRRRRITKAGHTHVGWLLCRRLDLLVCRLGIEPRTPDQKFGLGARSPRDLRVAGCRSRQISARFASQPQPGKSRRLTYEGDPKIHPQGLPPPKGRAWRDQLGRSLRLPASPWAYDPKGREGPARFWGLPRLTENILHGGDILVPCQGPRARMAIVSSEAVHDMRKMRLADASNEGEESAHQAPRLIQMHEPALQAPADPDRLVATLRQPSRCEPGVG